MGRGPVVLRAALGFEDPLDPTAFGQDLARAIGVQMKDLHPRALGSAERARGRGRDALSNALDVAEPTHEQDLAMDAQERLKVKRHGRLAEFVFDRRALSAEMGGHQGGIGLVPNALHRVRIGERVVLIDVVIAVAVYQVRW